MTPKEKAEQLLHEYRMLFMDEGEDYGQEILVTMLSVKCALIAVDEIIKFMEIDDEHNECLYFANSKWVQSLIEVKQEIAKL